MEMQRKFARENNVIMDGRDIGTVVLPEAELKIYLTASAEDRAMHRYKELLQKGQNVPFEEVLRDTNLRDEQDMNRAAAPLRKADDAIEADTTGMNLQESYALLCDIVITRLAVEPEAAR